MLKVKLKDVRALSVNAAWQGKRFRTGEYIVWRRTIEALMPKRKQVTGYVQVRVKFYLKHFGITGVDNLAKPLLDSIVNRVSIAAT